MISRPLPSVSTQKIPMSFLRGRNQFLEEIFIRPAGQGVSAQKRKDFAADARLDVGSICQTEAMSFT